LPTTNVGFWADKIGKNRIRDGKAVRALRKGGWTVFTLWQCELRNLDAAIGRLSVLAGKLGKRKQRRPVRRKTRKS
jgi:DNA mismatch endonuclease (patch repair protein)